ncbi:MAG: thioesterase family protein [Oleiphilaceae bacterium]|nr:thioesterase family protein [Oleiphilaceae bacterium]
MHHAQAVDRSHFGLFYPLQTRWMDNDIYGHVNNVTYYAYFDSAVNRYLIEAGGLDIHQDDVVAYVVNSSCNYFAPIAYPETIEVGIGIEHLGNRSVTYRVGIFKQDEKTSCAVGTFVHVFVSRAQGKAVNMPSQIRTALTQLEAKHEH